MPYSVLQYFWVDEVGWCLAVASLVLVLSHRRW
jgi:hypothetical protein